MKFLINVLENKVKSYDYSLVEKKEGVIVELYESRIYDDGSKKFKNFKYIDIKLTTGEIVTISLGSHSKYTKGEEITIYTNGEDYSITKQAVALDANNGVFYFIFISLVGIVVIYTWFYLFGAKGFLISIFLMAFGCAIFLS